jgi:hypothetical protein
VFELAQPEQAPGQAAMITDAAECRHQVLQALTCGVACVGPSWVDCVNDAMLAAAAAVTDLVEWRPADAAALPVLDATFDLVCCQQGPAVLLGPASRAPRGASRARARRAHRARRVAAWRPIEHHPAFAVLTDALEQHVGAEAAGMMRSPYEGPSSHALRQLLKDAGFHEPVIRIGVITVRFPSPQEFLRREAVSSPLAEPVGALDDGRRTALIAHLDQALPFMDDEGLVFPMETWLAVARR